MKKEKQIKFVCPLFCGWHIILTQEDIDRSGFPSCPHHEQTMIAVTTTQHEDNLTTVFTEQK